MSLIDLASLVLAPTAVKDGKVYNAIPNDQDFTFSRGTEATRVNSAGLIEKARTNFALYSNDFSQSVWQKLNNAVVSGQTATDPYGNANSAWDIVFDGTTSGRIEQSISGVISGGVYAPSIWARTKSGTQVVSFGSVFTENFTLTTEWQRISLYEVENDTTAYLRLVCNDAITLEVYAAQLEQGLVSTDVITTTTSSVTVGITDDLPRVDYSGGGCPSLLLEPSRTNLYTHSEYISNFSGTETFNSAISPEGVANAVLLTKTSDSDQYVNISWSGATLSTSTDYTLTAFVKHAGDDVNLRYEYNNSNDWGKAWNALFEVRSSGVTASTANGCTSDVENYGNDWYRIIVNVTTGSSITPSSPSNLIRVIGDNTEEVLIYGVQFEAGSYPSSYLPSYGTSTSRSADFAVLSNASNLIGQTEGTMFIEFTRENNSVGTFSISANNVGTRIYIGTNASGLICQVRNGYAQQAYFSTAQTEDTTYKCAIAYANNDFVLYMNGTQIGTDTSGTVPACNTIRTDDAGGANLNQPLKQAILFPTRLTNDQLAELTK